MNDCIWVAGSKGLIEVQMGTHGPIKKHLGPSHEGLPLENVSDIWEHPTNPLHVLITTLGHGVFFTLDGGETWSPSQGLAHIKFWTLCQGSHPDEVFVGGEPSCLYRSQDAGKTWENCATFDYVALQNNWMFHNPHHQHHVKSITPDPFTPHIYWASIEEGHLVRYNAQSDTFENLCTGIPKDMHHLWLDPQDSLRWVISSGIGIFLSRPGEAPSNHFRFGYCSRIISDASEELYCVASRVPPPAWFRPDGTGAHTSLWRSVDRGLSWEKASQEEWQGGCLGAWTAHPTSSGEFFLGVHTGELLHISERGQRVRTLASGLGRMGGLLVRTHKPALAPLTPPDAFSEKP